MSQWIEFALLIGIFLLRLGIPLAITLLIVWWLRRLDRKWEAEAEAYHRQEPESPDNNTPLQQRLPCWLLRNCPEDRKCNCPAARNAALPCWLVRLRAEGRLPSACPGCALFRALTSSHTQPTGV